MTTDFLVAISVIVALAAVAKLLANRYGIPNVVFLLAFGILVGPEGVGFLDPSLFRGDLEDIVGFAVAIIVFEGAFSLSLDRVRRTPRGTLRLVTVGSAITFVGLGVAIRYLVGLQWTLSLLVSALLVATGPTVITPILEQITVREDVRQLLETEGIINDPVASVLGAVVFSATLTTRRTANGSERGSDVVVDFVTQISVGVLVGIVTAVVVGYVLRELSTSPQDSRLVVLGSVLLSYTVGSAVATEAGVVTVAVAGLLLGSLDLPYRAEVAGFSGDVSNVVLGAVYLILAALIRFEDIVTLGVGGLAVVFVAIVVVRPLAVFVSTYGSDFSRNEQLFVASVGPRGIIPAATATLFTLQLSAAGVANAASVANLVFLVILVTVVIEAGGAPFIARMLDIVPMTTIIIGGGDIGRTLADRLEDQGDNPLIVERDGDVVAALRSDDYSVVHGNGTDADVLDDAGATDATMVVATTDDDATNVLACQTARSAFGVDTLVSLVNDPTRATAMEDLGVLTITRPAATATAIDELVSLPSLSEWKHGVGHDQNLAEEVVVSDDVDGERVADAGLPDPVVVVLLQRDGDYVVPTQDVVFRKGDRVTLLGRSDAVEDAVALLGEPSAG
ncbi:cation:proton antiporter domain-containing protein [Halomicrococcus gelatinilyticus]|uniref:cation:proton antiporter domain-containing protein n=1 Tax=Halomicrococcus gelatinilyticus TaxID=1702103 RepID=UPI002E0DE411